MCWINFAPSSLVPREWMVLGLPPLRLKETKVWPGASTLDQHLELLNRLCFLTAETFV